MDTKSLERSSPAISLVFPHRQPFMDGGHALAQAIVDTIREPLLVLDKDLRVVTANRSFYLTFTMNPQDVQDRPLYALALLWQNFEGLGVFGIPGTGVA
jgi:transcriptional regulator with PAS, ATPase and Fis domain